ncbi:EF-hand calcium-binding domain-containing protein 14-like isoform X2 [Patiria miniata]|uniref:EF-hand calcium-binding domain-containing protein 14 n=1 Tax=Patiria miniata TaxID=46514 RepID=A0A913ZCG0_PATMI|nr:EF-hand calcium-binding domain-containing protein 14-like isoform X2 [Patiria miniata]
MSGLEKDAAKMLVIDDSDSVDGEEYPLTQTQMTKPSGKKRRKVRVRRPQETCVCSGKSVVMVCLLFLMGCACGTLGYFVFQLKEDLKSINGRVTSLESELDTSKDLASTVSTLQSKIEQLQRLPVQISSITNQIGYLNLTYSQLQAKLKAVKNEIDNQPAVGSESLQALQQSTAQIGSTLQGVQSLQTQHTGQIDTLTTSLQQLQTSLTDLQGNVGKLQQAPSVPTPEPNDPASGTNNPSRLSNIETAVQSLQQEQEATFSVVTKLNSTLVSVGHWKQALMPRIVALESTPRTSDPSDSALAEKVDQLQSQVNTLMSSVQSQAHDPETGQQTPNPIESDTPTDWRHDIESEIQAIQKRLDQLNPQDLNNNLLNPNTTRGIQHQIEQSLSIFKKENLKSVDDLKQDNQAIWGRVYQQHSDIAELQKEVDALKVRVQDLENETGHVPTAFHLTDTTTSESSTQMTSDLQRPVRIPEISKAEDVEMNFFRMDENNDDFLTYSELSDFLGPATPPEDQLMKFDKNQDDKLDLAEFRTALGFPEE